MQVSITIKMTNTEAENFVKKPINGQGGFQSLLKRICENYCPATKTLNVLLEDAVKINHYATKFGQGGFQDRLAPIVEACKMIGQVAA